MPAHTLLHKPWKLSAPSNCVHAKKAESKAPFISSVIPQLGDSASPSCADIQDFRKDTAKCWRSNALVKVTISDKLLSMQCGISCKDLSTMPSGRSGNGNRLVSGQGTIGHNFWGVRDNAHRRRPHVIVMESVE